MISPALSVHTLAVEVRQEPSPELYLNLIEEEFAEFVEANKFFHPEDELKEMADLIYVLFGYARVMGYDLETAFKRVHKNNLKRIRQDDGTILRREDGKIIKNPNTPKVVLTDLIGEKLV